MINDLAASAFSASIWTWINTLRVDARLVLGTLCADNALWTATGRCANVSGLARAHCVLIYFTALAVGTAWGWHTRILPFSYLQYQKTDVLQLGSIELELAVGQILVLRISRGGS